jgi:CHRD domain
MRRHIFLILVAALALGAYAGAQAATAAHKTVICHARLSGKTPYRRIVTANRATIRAHTLAHHGDIINPAGGQCPTQPLSFRRGGRPVSAGLVPVPPNTVGEGSFVARTNFGQGRICWRLTVVGLADVTAAHIHYRLGDMAGQIALPLALPTPFTGNAIGCTNTSRALVKQILRNPPSFYVNVHTTTYPGGAISGTLKPKAKP